MSKIKALTAVFWGTLAYVLLSFFGGQDGLWAERQLETQKREISLRTAALARINTELQLEYQALKSDPEVIASFARKLGYVSDGEKLVKINGLSAIAQPVYDTGTVLKRSEVRSIPEWVCKLTGICVAALVLCLFLLREALIYSMKNKPVPLYSKPSRSNSIVFKELREMVSGSDVSSTEPRSGEGSPLD